MRGVLVVVHRVRLRLADDAPVDHVLGLGQPDLLQLGLGQGDEVGVAGRPQAVALEAEVFEAVAVQRRVGDHLRRPRLEVLHPADFDRRVVDVNPVVRELLAVLEDQRHRQELAVSQLVRRVPGRLARLGRQAVDELLHRRGADDVFGHDLLEAAVRADVVDDPAVVGVVAVQADDLAAHLEVPAEGLHLLGARLPEHPRPEPRVAEGANQRLDHPGLARFRLGLPQGVENRGLERQPLNALCGPVGGDFFAAHPPDFFRVGLEEDVEQPLAELIAHPVLERLRVLRREGLRPGVGEDAAGRLEDAELGQRLAGLERVLEEGVVVKDARRPRPVEHVVGQDFGPEVFDFLRLGEEAVPADVEVEALVLGRPRDAADVLGVGFEDDHRHVGLRQLVGGGEARGAGTDDEDGGLLRHGEGDGGRTAGVRRTLACSSVLGGPWHPNRRSRTLAPPEKCRHRPRSRDARKS